MLEKTDSTSSPKQISFSADFLASHTVQPGSEKARQMTVISGRNISALLANTDPLGLLVKMCLESEQLFSTRCYLTWKAWTTPQSRLLFRLRVSMPPTSEKEYLLLPTPEGLAAMGMLPTPTASDTSQNDYYGKSKKLSGVIGGKLNPEFVEWLMGFPIGWTELEHSETP